MPSDLRINVWIVGVSRRRRTISRLTSGLNAADARSAALTYGRSDQLRPAVVSQYGAIDAKTSPFVPIGAVSALDGKTQN